MRSVREALAELQAAEEAIETAGPLYQTREPLKDKIVRLIGQRSDLITQVLTLRRELDAARAEVEKLRALTSTEDLEVNEFEQELVGELLLHGYDLPVARMVTELVCQNLIDPFGLELPTVRKALESLGVFDLESLQAKLSS